MSAPRGLRAKRRSLAIAAITILVCAIVASPASAGAESEFGKAHVHTDGRFDPGSRETILVRGFPGAGVVTIAFFPTAICEGGCSAVTRYAGRTNGAGAGRLHVRVPGYFFKGKRKVYFLDRERLNLQVMWEGHGEDEFDVGEPKHAPVFRRH